MLSIIWYYLRNFKNVNNTHGGVLLAKCLKKLRFSSKTFELQKVTILQSPLNWIVERKKAM